MPVTTTAAPLNLPSPATPGRKVLDPRLRRLVHDSDRQASARLRADVESAFVTSSAPLPPTQLLGGCPRIRLFLP